MVDSFPINDVFKRVNCLPNGIEIFRDFIRAFACCQRIQSHFNSIDYMRKATGKISAEQLTDCQAQNLLTYITAMSCELLILRDILPRLGGKKMLNKPRLRDFLSCINFNTIKIFRNQLVAHLAPEVIDLGLDKMRTMSGNFELVSVEHSWDDVGMIFHFPFVDNIICAGLGITQNDVDEMIDTVRSIRWNLSKVLWNSFQEWLNLE